LGIRNLFQTKVYLGGTRELRNLGGGFPPFGAGITLLKGLALLGNFFLVLEVIYRKGARVKGLYCPTVNSLGGGHIVGWGRHPFLNYYSLGWVGVPKGPTNWPFQRCNGFWRAFLNLIIGDFHFKGEEETPNSF